MLPFVKFVFLWRHEKVYENGLPINFGAPVIQFKKLIL